MMFWFVCAVLTLAVAAIIAMPVLRPRAAAEAVDPDIAIYRAQLDEIDRDLARGVLEADEAERARAEVARRLIAADRAERPQNRTGGPARLTGAVMILALIAIGFGVYLYSGAPGYGDLPLAERLANSDRMRAERPDQAALEAAAPPPPPVSLPQDYVDAIAQLREIAPTRPDDQEAWERLAYHEVEMRNYAAAAAAQEQVIAIKGDAALVSDVQRLLDLKVVAAGGLISPEAEVIARQILERDENNTAALYYIGALYNQTDRPDLALRIWQRIIEEGDPSNFHVSRARAQAADAAFRAGIDYALPETRGPSAAQIADAQDMSPEDQQAMIGGMVAGLAQRLATEGGPAQDWARLIRAYGVLGEIDAARAVWTEASQVFIGSMRGMEILTNAARDAGVLDE